MKGINFIEPLFLKVVNGEKTQTRRIIKPQPDFLSENFKFAKQNDGKIILPRYESGETLYLKEPYRIIHPGQNTFEIEWRYTGKISLYYYHLFDDNTEIKTWVEKRLKEQKKSVWCNKLFAPQFASKHFIETTGVRAERLREISDEDCIREGIVKEGEFRYHNGTMETTRREKIDAHNYCNCGENHQFVGYRTPQDAYAALINKINGKGTWASNPFVWVYDFELTKHHK